MVEQPGDSREVAIITSESVDITFSIKSEYTTADDTATTKYFDNVSKSVDKFALRPSAVCQIKSINGVEFTDPITVAANGIYSETGCIERYGGVAELIVTCTADTQLKLRII